MKRFMIRLVTLLCIAPLSGVVMAHTGGHHAYGFINGVMHPLLGVDHLAAILAVGMWAATTPAHTGWKIGIAFCVSMLAGAILAMQGIVLPGIETGIAMSVLIAGLMLVACGRFRISGLGGGMLVALLALFHGQAHGLEIPAAASVTLYASGFALTTATLLLVSRTLVKTIHTRWLIRSTGFLSGALGVWLLLGA